MREKGYRFLKFLKENICALFQVYDEKAIAEWKEAKRLFELPPEGEQLPPNFEAVIRECERVGVHLRFLVARPAI